MKKSEIHIYTDGSSRGNPGPGGWGAVLYLYPEQVIELGGKQTDTTNNRMELSAVIEGLLYLERKGVEVASITVHSDSTYVLKGITEWVYGWEKNNWFTKTGDSVLNQDLWSALLEISRRLKLKSDIVWEKVKGHAGVLENERADMIATTFADEKTILLFSGTKINYTQFVGTMPAPKKHTTSNKGKAYSYVSLINGVIFIDHDWKSCETRVKGTKGARYKKAFSKEDEEKIRSIFLEK